jgi:hypothetical protein
MTTQAIALKHRLLFACVLVLAFPIAGHAEDTTKAVRDSVVRATLNQNGTKPFHLKAVIGPSQDRDKDKDLTGEVEYWWVSPMQWKRELRSSHFHQILIANGDKRWEKHEGEYFPEWLQACAAELINPAPLTDDLFQPLKGAEVRHLFGTTYYSWALPSSDGTVQKTMGAGISITDESSLPFTANGFGWDGLFHDYKSFHGRMIARTVASGNPEATAHVTTLEDLGAVPPALFAPDATGWSATPLQTLPISETLLRQNLMKAGAPVWPPVANGPVRGITTTEIVVDTAGNVREIGTVVTDNPALDDAAVAWIRTLHFQPFLSNGAPTQVLSRMTFPFRTNRPGDTEIFDSALSIFEKARQQNFLAARRSKPYVLRAEFSIGIASGKVAQGTYTDTWQSSEQWRREANIEGSHCIRTQNNQKRYLLEDGTDAGKAKFILQALEPIPAIDTFVESDWRISRQDVDGRSLIRVITGYEAPDGKLDPKVRAFWFDDKGSLVKSHILGMDILRDNIEDYDGVPVARLIRVKYEGKLVSIIKVSDISPATDVPPATFSLKGHEWTRAFTDQVR